MILHVLDAATDGATEINIHSPDTDVLVLALRRYPELCNDVNFITGTGLRHRVIKLKSTVQAHIKRKLEDAYLFLLRMFGTCLARK